MAIQALSGRTVALLAIWCLSASGLLAQTEVKLPKNRYTPEQDVKLGREAAAEIEKEYPIIKDERITKYLTMLGDRLIAAAPPALKNPAYQYSFTPVNLKEINAFALPGGPMFVHRGMFTAGASEAEVVGVMAHELSHVLLRHGTANVSKAQNPWLQIGQIAGQIGGAMVGGGAGAMIAQGAEMGLGAVLLRYSRDFEKQADLLGAQIMARAGYDPRALGRMFETIERESKSGGGGGGGTPQWLSSHPNPGNRTAYINKEAESLTITTAADDSEFAPVKAVFASLPSPLTMEELARRKSEGGGTAMRSVGTPGQPVPPPSAEYQAIAGGKLFQAQVPANWTALSTSNSIRIVPENGFGEMNGQTVFSHGIEFGIAQAGSRDLRQATEAWLKAVAQNNPQLKLAGEARQMTFSQRPAIGVPLVNPSPLGGQERIGLYTMFVGNGSALFYYLTIVPEKDSQAFQETFRRIAESVRFTDGR
jgi:Zn-dependent protease with chaperone function